MILHFSLQLFHCKHYRSRCLSRWENLDSFQHRSQPIKFVNSVVPSPCETQPYKKDAILLGKRRFKNVLRPQEMKRLITAFSKSSVGLV